MTTLTHPAPTTSATSPVTPTTGWSFKRFTFAVLPDESPVRIPQALATACVADDTWPAAFPKDLYYTETAAALFTANVLCFDGVPQFLLQHTYVTHNPIQEPIACSPTLIGWISEMLMLYARTLTAGWKLSLARYLTPADDLETLADPLYTIIAAHQMGMEQQTYDNDLLLPELLKPCHTDGFWFDLQRGGVVRRRGTPDTMRQAPVIRLDTDVATFEAALQAA